MGPPSPSNVFLILPTDVPLWVAGVAGEGGGGEVGAVQVDGGDLAVFVGRVVINAARGIAAGRVLRDLVSVPDRAAAADLLDRAENVEKLIDALRFACA